MWPSMRLGGLVGHGSWVTRGSISERCCRGNVSEDGHSEIEVTVSVWPLKYLMYELSCVERYRIVSSTFVLA
jgi:hypothetical protein